MNVRVQGKRSLFYLFSDLLPLGSIAIFWVCVCKLQIARGYLCFSQCVCLVHCRGRRRRHRLLPIFPFRGHRFSFFRSHILVLSLFYSHCNFWYDYYYDVITTMAYHFMCRVMILRGLFDEWKKRRNRDDQTKTFSFTWFIQKYYTRASSSPGLHVACTSYKL